MSVHRPNWIKSSKSSLLAAIWGGELGGLVVANIIGFPEVEIGEAGVVAVGADGAASLELMDAVAGEPMASIAVGAIADAGPGAIVGGTLGYLATQPVPPDTSLTQLSSTNFQGPGDTGFCPD